jgi:hypothetical protein
VLVKDRWSDDNITHVAIVIYLALTVVAVPMLRRLSSAWRPFVVFVAACMLSAAVVEACYMITAPLDPSLRIGPDTGLRDGLRHLAVDLALTAPAYVIIFAAIAWLASRYAYRPAEFIVLTAAGQAIGDGMAFLAANPAMLLFLPYLMLNYHAMTLAPYLALHGRIGARHGRRGMAMVAAPLIGLPVVYGIAGTAIVLAGRALGWLPQPAQ